MMSDNIYEENGDDQRNEETTPLMLSGRQDSVESGNNTTNNKRKRNSSVRLSVIAILIGSLCGMAIIAWGQRQQQQRKRRNEGQTIVIAKPDGNNTTPEAVGPEEFSVSNSYRPICEYYYYGTSDTTTNPPPPPRILQTSMYEPSKPWSVLEPCRRASDPTTVQLNVAGNPDAILLVNFSTPTTSTATTDSSTAAVHSRPTILGFGGAFTEASALNFARLSALGQESVLELLFGRTGLGYSLGRMPIHSCDFAVAPYTFDDRVDDMELKQFKVSHDVPTIFRLAQAAVQTYQAAWIRPRSTSSLDNKQSAATSHSIGDDNYVSGDDGFRLFASPWSPPAWMKRPTWQDSKNATHATSMMYSAQPNCLRDGVGPDSLYAATWARYISKFVTALRETTGLRLWAVTVQNEPEFAAPWEACAYTATNMTDFVAYHLGPVLSRDHADLKILAFDHNKDHINTWMMTMLNGTASSSDQDTTTTTDSRSRSSSSSSSIAAPYIAGTAYHWYAGGTWYLCAWITLRKTTTQSD